MDAKTLNKQWNINARHALYSTPGDWYHRLTNFPGALFDPKGYILFKTEEDFKNCPHLQINQDVHVPNGISSIPGYIKVIED